MVGVKTCAVGIAALAGIVASAGARAADTIALRESVRTEGATRVKISLTGEGKYVATATATGETATGGKPLALKVASELEFIERVLSTDARGRAARAVRRALRATAAINGEVRPSSASLRADVALLVAERNGSTVLVYSPLGPLTRPELEVVQGPGDPLALGGLLPDEPVARGARWKLNESAVKALTDYDTLVSGGIEATLDSFDANSARVALRGEVRGTVLGGEGTMACNGTYTFDRKAALLDRLTLERAETRRPGPVEGGLDIKSRLSVTRAPSELAPELTDKTLARVILNPGPDRDLLLLVAPDGAYSLRHDRDWHIYWDDPRVTVLKRVERGEVVAQCNLAAGPHAGKGKHQDLNQFRDDVRKGLGNRFATFLGAGEVDGDPAGGYRYKLGVQGRQGDLAVVWYYYLIAGPEGDQLLATFTLASSRSVAFADRDEALIGTLRWRK